MNFADRISAVHLMQRFVRMSRVLLPMYSSLANKNNLTPTELSKIEGIRSVYDNFKASPETSRYLINSDILSMIQAVYSALINKSGDTPESFYLYNEFIKESDRLIATWDKQQMN